MDFAHDRTFLHLKAVWALPESHRQPVLKRLGDPFAQEALAEAERKASSLAPSFRQGSCQMHSGRRSLLMVFGFLSVHLAACVLAVCPPFPLMAQCTRTRPRSSPSLFRTRTGPSLQRERKGIRAPEGREHSSHRGEDCEEPQAHGHFGFGHLTQLLVLMFQLCPCCCHREAATKWLRHWTHRYFFFSYFVDSIQVLAPK